jgi:para-nitrobenzyl esterase
MGFPSVVSVGGGLVAGLPADANGVHAYLGIPYAAPPVGALRWRAPQPVRSWHGVRGATVLAPQCLQAARAPDSVYAEFAGNQPMSEDCLYLNVWTAAPRADAGLPVMVWIHGGAFQQGSGGNPVFVRGDLPRQGVVLVTLNYRLGPFGFMAHPALTQEAGGHSGNYGLLDIEAALRWVRHNIARFGGDPSQVTIFGQSAGAAAVVDMMAAPRTRGLFARAVAQSFGVTEMASLQQAEASGQAFADRVDGDIARLRELDGAALLQAYLAQAERWMPIVDGEFITRPVRETFAARDEAHVPLLTGWNADEGTTFPAASGVVELRQRLNARFGERAAAAEQFYPHRNDAQARAASLALTGDELFAAGVWAAARAHAKVAPTYLYHFDHPHPFADDQRYREADKASDLGVFHSSEYPFVFGTTAELTRRWGEADRRMTGLMQRLWLQFAKTGNPNGPEPPRWPRFDDTRPTVLRLASATSLIDVPRRAHLSFVQGTP